jgi:two-component system, OmpR family, phosphate regulon response regulator PhoB
LEKLLIADDERSVRLLVSATLASDRYHILEASTGAQAFELIRDEHPRMVLLDVRMPDVDGLEICRRVRSDPGFNDVAIIMLTGDSAPDQVEQGLAAGANQYLTKPFSPLQLLQIVESIMH